MKAIVVTDQAAGAAGMKLVERPQAQGAINDVVVQVHASGFVGSVRCTGRVFTISTTFARPR